MDWAVQPEGEVATTATGPTMPGGALTVMTEPELPWTVAGTPPKVTRVPGKKGPPKRLDGSTGMCTNRDKLKKKGRS